ncbi:MAG TPA: HlyD family efflux transporter periplasmic adaptor subunit [Saprospiraceae bacterium]|nr:HlyD family efflux transporter periplasmic adaptor subunit [Saprospiraceae bacterium]
MSSKYIYLLLSTSFIISCKNKEIVEIKPVVQDIQEWVFAPGQIEWDDAYNLTAQTDGILLNANYDIGTVVKKGSIIATIDNQSNVINTSTASDQLVIANENLSVNAPALQQLKQNISFAEAKYQQDKLQADRYERLQKTESIAKVEYENAKLAAENALTNLNALRKQYDLLLQQAKQQNIVTKGQLKNNQVVQSYNKITVINDGTIIKKMKSTGDYVRKGDIIATVANPNKLEIALTIDESSIHRVKIGQETKIQLNTDKSKTYTGKVNEILTAFDNASQSFVCKVILTDTLAAASNIYGTPLEGNILVGEKKNALLIPREYMGYGNKVMLKGQDTALTIKTGIVSTDYVEVLEGLTANDVLAPIKP